MIFVERGHQVMKDKCLSDKSISSSPNECKSNNSYCRSIIFHDKEIKSYSTTSSIDSNQTVLCLSINDIVEKYFPWTTSEEFIQLCRIKQIIRYKPDKSTHSDLSLRLINIQQLEQFWNFFNQKLLPKSQPTSSQQSLFDQCSKYHILFSEKNQIIHHR